MVRGRRPDDGRPPDWRILALAAAHSYEEAARELYGLDTHPLDSQEDP